MHIEQKLSIDKFSVDEGNPHITIHPDVLDTEIIRILTIVCPAGVYTIDNQGRVAFEFAGCLECGTCRVAVAHKPNVMEWKYPNPSFGVQFRYG